jgi:hypothetical protein
MSILQKRSRTTQWDVLRAPLAGDARGVGVGVGTTPCRRDLTRHAGAE